MEELIDDRYLAPVFKKLDELAVDDIIIISDVAPNKPDLWINCAKQYHKSYKNLLFSSDYKSVKKVKGYSEIISDEKWMPRQEA